MKIFSRLALIAVGLSFLGLSAFAQKAQSKRADAYPRTAVMEVFTGEWCGWCPLGKFFVEKAYKQLSPEEQARVVISYVHDGDFITQQFPLVGSYGGSLANAFGVTGFPNAVIDRTKTTTFNSVAFNPNHGDEKLLKAIRERLAQEAPGAVDFTLTKNGDEFTMNIKGELASSLAGQDVYISSYLIRDSIPKKSQSNYVTSPSQVGGDPALFAEYQAFWKNFKHDHTILQPLTSAQGEKVTPDADGKFSMTKAFTPNFAPYNTDYSHVVVILHFANSTKKGIINAMQKDMVAGQPEPEPEPEPEPQPQPALKEVMLEQFTTEKCGYCPGGATTINNVITSMIEEVKVSWVSHHAGFNTDFLTVPESTQLLSLYSIGGGQGTFAPAFMVNRNKVNGKVVHGVSAANVKNLINFAKEHLASGIEIESEISYDKDTRKFKIKVNAPTTSEFTGGNDLYLNVALTEDNIKAQNQAGAGSNYIHNHVLRRLLGGANGQKVEPSAATYEWEYDIPNDWKTDKMKVIVFAHHAKTNTADPSVYRSREYPFPVASTISDVLDQNMKVYAVNGDILIEGEYQSFRVFDMQGRMHAGKNLQAGTYVVSIEANTGKIIKKVVVK
ncbi:hypothetical protein HQ40_09185 [Porphyromonas gulae]|uniref:Hemin-binding protein n=2 Tax=Porphyromonas gulae TaxID=111105 RepID=A0A0A2FAR5_9PORP|nr:Omp28-related outer membrane protein [Porphyromonas gulae]KGN73656.1 hypothetical protein HQ40_09185 [Porphyromonas gulae]KGN87172.1 hypothetical protein HR08_02685 [Porphyromonas gulae]